MVNKEQKDQDPHQDFKVKIQPPHRSEYDEKRKEEERHKISEMKRVA
jgi:hypothetical protein